MKHHMCTWIPVHLVQITAVIQLRFHLNVSIMFIKFSVWFVSVACVAVPSTLHYINSESCIYYCFHCFRFTLAFHLYCCLLYSGIRCVRMIRMINMLIINSIPFHSISFYFIRLACWLILLHIKHIRFVLNHEKRKYNRQKANKWDKLFFTVLVEDIV